MAGMKRAGIVMRMICINNHSHCSRRGDLLATPATALDEVSWQIPGAKKPA
jgi:hypothetical protein